jgi:hypothetical protein
MQSYCGRISNELIANGVFMLARYARFGVKPHMGAAMKIVLLVVALAALVSGLGFERHYASMALGSPRLYRGIKKDLLAKTAQNPAAVEHFFEADLLVVLSYSSAALLISCWAIPAISDWLILGALGLCLVGAAVDLTGNVVCIRYAEHLLGNASVASPASLMAGITLIKSCALVSSLILFVPIIAFTLWRKL